MKLLIDKMADESHIIYKTTNAQQAQNLNHNRK